MSERLPRITSAQAARILEKAGFTLVRQSGSHMIYKNSAGLRAILPFHAGKILHPKVLQSILTDANLSVDDLRRLLK